MIEAERILCPYCGSVQPGPADQCQRCGGLFDPLSRRLSQQQMGPWFIRDPRQPFLPGCSYGMLRELIRRGRVGPETVVRGPTTRQFWSLARHVAGVAHLLGLCHRCGATVEPTDEACHACGSRFHAPAERHVLGLDPENPDLEREVAAARERDAQPTGAGATAGGAPGGSDEEDRAEHAAGADGEEDPRAQGAAADPATALSYLADAPEQPAEEGAEGDEPAGSFDQPATGAETEAWMDPPRADEAGQQRRAVGAEPGAERGPGGEAPVASIGHVPVTAGAPDSMQRVPYATRTRGRSGSGGAWVIWLLVALNVLMAVGIVLLLFWQGPSGPTIPSP